MRLIELGYSMKFSIRLGELIEAVKAIIWALKPSEGQERVWPPGSKAKTYRFRFAETPSDSKLDAITSIIAELS